MLLPGLTMTELQHCMSVFEINSCSRDYTDLGVDMSTNGMNSVSDIFPARNLVFVPESRSVRPVRAMDKEHQTKWNG